MFISGIADEAGKDIDTQIKAHKELGWRHIELRTITGRQFTDVPDAEFKDIAAKLKSAGIQVSCFASAIANWATKITDPLEKELETLDRSIPRMHALGTRFIRVMGWPNNNLPEAEWKARAVKGMKALAQRAEKGKITLVLENCDGWPSHSAQDFVEFFALVDSPALKAVYDTGNAVGHGDADAWPWYEKAKPFIAYVHIKNNGGKEAGHIWPDAASPSRVDKVIADLRKSGYDGGFSIEPHMKAVIHTGEQISDAEAAYQTYIEYGRRLNAMLAQAYTP